MRPHRLLNYWALVLWCCPSFYGQSGIELPKPNAGALGIHFKLMQSIPYKSGPVSGPFAPRFPEGGKTMVVPVFWAYKDKDERNETGLEYRIWNLVSGDAIGSPGFLKAPSSITSSDISVAAGCNGEKLEFYRLGAEGVLTPTAIAKEKTTCSDIGDLGFQNRSTLSRDGQFLALAVNGEHIQIWESRTAKLLTTVGTSDKITHLSFSADATMLLASAADGTVQVWAIPSGQPIHTFEAQDHLDWADFVTGRSAVAAVTSNYSVFLWDLKTGQRLSFFDLNADPWTWSGGRIAVVLSPDGRLLIVGGDSVKYTSGETPIHTAGAAYDLQSGARVASIEGSGHPSLEDIEVNADGTMLAMLGPVGSDNYIVRIWRIERE